MIGIQRGLVRKIQQRAEKAKWTHCFVHRKNFAIRLMSPELTGIKSATLKTMNYMKKNILYYLTILIQITCNSCAVKPRFTNVSEFEQFGFRTEILS